MESEKIKTIQEKIEAIDFGKYFMKYFKIFGFSFIIPMWIVAFVNGGAVLGKLATWYNQEFVFWEDQQSWSMTLILLIGFPIVYLVWCYYVTIKKILLQAFHDFFKHWHKEAGVKISQSLILQYQQKQGAFQWDPDAFFMWLNNKISKLPKWLQWITKKIFDQIPLLEFVNAYDAKDLKNGNEENLATGIENKLNEFVLGLIDDIVPLWTKFIIPVNILLLIFYFKM